MNKARRLKVQEMLKADPALTPKKAYDLTKKFKFAGELKTALTAKGLDVSKNRPFTQEELLVVQSTMKEMLEARVAAEVTENVDANPNS